MNIQQSTEMSQLQRLKKLQKSNKTKAQTANMTAFEDLVAIYVGASIKEHFPKLRDDSGKVIKDEKGRDMRAEKRDGFTHVFSQFGTSKMIQIVLPREMDVQINSAYLLSGLGYDIKTGNMIFIEKDGKIANY